MLGEILSVKSKGILLNSEIVEETEINVAGKLWHAFSALKLPSIPILTADDLKLRTAEIWQQLNRRIWQNWLNTLNIRPASEKNANDVTFALQITAQPRQSGGADINVNFLFGITSVNQEEAVSKMESLLVQAESGFPNKLSKKILPKLERLLEPNQIREVFGHNLNFNETNFWSVQKHLEKRELKLGAERLSGFIPHPFQFDNNSSIWSFVFNYLENATAPIIIRCVSEPVFFSNEEEEFLRFYKTTYSRLIREGNKQEDLIDQKAARDAVPGAVNSEIQSNNLAKMLADPRPFKALAISPGDIAFAERGKFVFDQFNKSLHSLFSLKFLIVSPFASLGQGTAKALVSTLSHFENNKSDSLTGFKMAEIKELNFTENQFYGFCRLSKSDQSTDEAKKNLWLNLVTINELSHILQVPVFDDFSSGISGNQVPFSLSFEALHQANQFSMEEDINLGFLFNGDKFHTPDKVGEKQTLPFGMNIKSLNLPAIASGVPGAGKSNFLIHLLVELWRNHRIPFLVLDPGTGQEFRYLLNESSLKDDLIVYTAGDEKSFPFRFNPFALPPAGPGGTINLRSHINKLMAAFKASSEFFDPLPEIFFRSLVRTYRKLSWDLEDTYETGTEKGLNPPCLTDFADTMEKELHENVLPVWGTSSEAAGVLLGGSKIRVEAIINQCGNILSVGEDTTQFFQTLIKQPVVLELGSVGSEEMMAVVMSFLLVQLSGHLEYQYRVKPRIGNLNQLLCIDEAHILLEEPSMTAQSLGNPRGKAANDLNRLLAEFRKFGSGVILLDQRVASLVKGAIDNATHIFMFKTVEEKSFDRFSKILNLTAEQIVYARKRLGKGQLLTIDPLSGETVLMRPPNVIDELRKETLSHEKFFFKIADNARKKGLKTPNLAEYDSSEVIQERVSPDETSSNIWKPRK